MAACQGLGLVEGAEPQASLYGAASRCCSKQCEADPSDCAPWGAGRKLPRRDGVVEPGALALPGRAPALQWLVQWMLARDPAARPTARDLLLQARPDYFCDL